MSTRIGRAIFSSISRSRQAPSLLGGSRQFVSKTGNPILKITDRASARIKQLMEKKNDPDVIGVRVGLKTRGCNGLTYTMNYTSEEDLKKFDEVMDDPTSGSKVVVDAKAVMFLIGTEMDFVEDALSSEFTFNNPNSKGECGCGQSFNV